MMLVEMDSTLAHAIVDMDDNGHQTGFGPITPMRLERWIELADKAALFINRKPIGMTHSSWSLMLEQERNKEKLQCDL
ncbi:MAG: hypothetical protein ACYSW8_26630 [Planctomycetota bacterium]|jgi:hypothetical protein